MTEITDTPALLWVAPEMYPEPGGIGNQTAYLAKHLAELGYRITVLADTTLIGEAEAQTFDARQPYTVLRMLRRRFAWLTYLERISRMHRQVRRHRQVVCSGKWPIWLMGVLAPWYRREWVAVVHGSELDLPSGLGRWWLQRSLSRAHKIIAVSAYTAKHLPNFKGARVPKVEVIGNGIDPEEFSGVGVNGFQRPEHGYPALITVGSVKERKGQRKVIEALPKILEQYPKARYHIVGLPHEESALRRRAQELGLQDAVVFHGVQPRETVQHLLKASDVFLLPSQHTDRGDFEGYGIAILEANVLGVPAVASQHSGSSDAVTDDSGLLIDQATPETLAGAVDRLMEQRDQYAAGARQFARTRSWKAVAQAYHQFLQQSV